NGVLADLLTQRDAWSVGSLGAAAGGPTAAATCAPTPIRPATGAASSRRLRSQWPDERYRMSSFEGTLSHDGYRLLTVSLGLADALHPGRSVGDLQQCRRECHPVAKTGLEELAFCGQRGSTPSYAHACQRSRARGVPA